MFEFNYSVGDIRNSDLGEGIVCLGERSGDKRGGKWGGKWGKGGGKLGKRGREVGIRGEGSGECLHSFPPPLSWVGTLKIQFLLYGACKHVEVLRPTYLTTLFPDRLSPLIGLSILLHLRSAENDNYPPLLSGRKRMTEENISLFND